MRRLASTLLLLSLCTLAGCAAAGVAAYKVFGDTPVDPAYQLPKVPTVVLVENFQSPDATRDDADQLARNIIDDLRKKDKRDKKGAVAVEFLPLIDPMKVYDLRSNDPVKYRKMRIQEIGRAVGAKQVLYVDLGGAGVQTMMGSDMLRGAGSARVMVVNCETGQTQWPQESGAGYPVGFESKLLRPADDITYDRVRNRTLEALAHRVGRLFYKWKPDEEEEYL
jgi:hypothetical protein